MRMVENETNQLRKFYQSLIGQQQVLEEKKKDYAIDESPVKILEDEINFLRSQFPDVVPLFNRREFEADRVEGYPIYNLAGIRSYLSSALGRLKIEIDEPTTPPVTQKRKYSFVTNSDLRRILQRDFAELQRAFISECWKSVIILCGGSIEGVLTDLLLNHEGQAKGAKSAPTKLKITKWNLSTLIDVSLELKFISPGVQKLSHSLREYRNLVHPGRELRDKLVFDAEEAKIAFEVLNILYRDLSKT